VHAGLHAVARAAPHAAAGQTSARCQWIVSSAARWFEELGLTRREQETARRDLVPRRASGRSALRGIPPSLVARIRLDCLLALLTDDAAPAGDVRPALACRPD
jgi:hypothetical protein